MHLSYLHILAKQALWEMADVWQQHTITCASRGEQPRVMGMYLRIPNNGIVQEVTIHWHLYQSHTKSNMTQIQGLR